MVTLTDKSFKGIIEQYSSSWQNRTAKDFENIDIILNKNIYGFDNDDRIKMKMDVKEFIATTTYGQLVIKKINSGLDYLVEKELGCLLL